MADEDRQELGVSLQARKPKHQALVPCFTCLETDTKCFSILICQLKQSSNCHRFDPALPTCEASQLWHTAHACGVYTALKPSIAAVACSSGKLRLCWTGSELMKQWHSVQLVLQPSSVVEVTGNIPAQLLQHIDMTSHNQVCNSSESGTAHAQVQCHASPGAHLEHWPCIVSMRDGVPLMLRLQSLGDQIPCLNQQPLPFHIHPMLLVPGSRPAHAASHRQVVSGFLSSNKHAHCFVEKTSQKQARSWHQQHAFSCPETGKTVPQVCKQQVYTASV